MEKYMPKIGDKLYLRQRTGSYYIDMCKRPFTVVSVDKGIVTIREARCIFPYPRYYDTLPIRIEDDADGKKMKLKWSNKWQRWQETPVHGDSKYAEFAVFGEWDYMPYLD